MLSRRLALLYFSCLLGGVVLRGETSASIEPVLNGSEGLGEEPNLQPGALTLEIRCWNQEEMKKFLIFAVNQGAPLFNKGDHYGCYRIYDFSANRIVWLSAHCPDRSELAKAAKTLRVALERAEITETAKEKAWTYAGHLKRSCRGISRKAWS